MGSGTTACYCECVRFCKEALESSVEAVAEFVKPDAKCTELLIRITTDSKVNVDYKDE